MSLLQPTPTLLVKYFLYGFNDRAGHVLLEFPIPAEYGKGDNPKVTQWAVDTVRKIYKDMKHTRDWGCEVCGQPARVASEDIMFWPDPLKPTLLQIDHYLCDTSKGPCIEAINAEREEMARDIPSLSQSKRAIYNNPNARGEDFPLTSSCKRCRKDFTGMKDFPIRRCGGCHLTRYCSPECQKADWPDHKLACRHVKHVEMSQD